jgi:Histidine kinase-like ATPase domain
VFVTLELVPEAASVREARRFTVDTLRGWGREDLTTDAALLVTELVTNAVLHARTVIQVCLRKLENSVRLEVHDGSPARPSLRYHGPEATTGRGMAMVALLAESWGVDVAGEGKSVWAHLIAEADEESPPGGLSVAPPPEAPTGPGRDSGPEASGPGPSALAGPEPSLGLCA